MKNRFLAVSLALTALLLTGCQGQEQAAGTSSSPSPEQSTPVSWEQSESPSPEQTETPSPESPEGGTESIFTPGTWLATAEDGSGQYYFFNPDGTTGSTASLDNGTGVSFAYECEDGYAVFHMAAVDNNTPCTVEVTDSEHIILRWDTGGTTDLAYVSALGTGQFTFYSDSELFDLALAYYQQTTGSELGHPAISFTNNEDGTVTIHLFENLSDHIATAAWYTVNRFTARGVNDISGEPVDLSSAG